MEQSTLKNFYLLKEKLNCYGKILLRTKAGSSMESPFLMFKREKQDALTFSIVCIL